MSDSIWILYVGDEPEFSELATTPVEREDDRFITETATSASAGLERLSDRDFDCIISDYDMDGMNGIEFLKTVRRDDPDLPFILFTGQGNEEIPSEAISAGVTDYVQKQSGTGQYVVLGNRILNAVESYRSRQILTDRNRELRKYERMVNTMQEAACIYDPDGYFEIVNEYLADWYGTTRTELEGRKSDLVPHVRDQGETDQYEELLNGAREEIHGELAGEFPRHGYAVLEYRLTQLTVNGRVEGTVGVARDITEHKEREQELQRQNERLNEFASVVSHDLRNPLQLATGRLDLAQAECESEHLEGVSRGLDRMDVLLDDLLTLAREGETVSETEQVDLATIVEAAWATVETDSATLVTDTNRTVSADKSRLRQVFENLVGNAIKHGGGDVTVTVGDLDDGFYVEDTGPGIPKDKREEVFEAGHSTNETGTGFGLSIIEQVIEAHGWEIAISDSSTGGARFEITGVEFAG